MLIGQESCRSGPLETLGRQGFQCVCKDDPYAAMAELARRPFSYRAIVLSLQSCFREELGFIPAVKRRWPHLEIWLTHTDGREKDMAAAMRMGAEGLLTEDGELHRTAIGGASTMGMTPLPGGAMDDQRGPMTIPPFSLPDISNGRDDDQHELSHHSDDLHLDENTGEPVLTADELRALLQDPPAATMPAAGNEG